MCLLKYDVHWIQGMLSHTRSHHWSRQGNERSMLSSSTALICLNSLELLRQQAVHAKLDQLSNLGCRTSRMWCTARVTEYLRFW